VPQLSARPLGARNRMRTMKTIIAILIVYSIWDCSQSPHTRQQDNEDVKAIYIALVDTILNRPFANLSKLVLADSTILLREDWCQLIKDQSLSSLSCNELQISYDSVIQQNQSLRALSIPFDSKVVLVRRDSMLNISSCNKGNYVDWFCVSAIGFNLSHQQAVVCYKQYCSLNNRVINSDYLYGSIIFTKSLGKWNVKDYTCSIIRS
jgi:hypothetical protein